MLWSRDNAHLSVARDRPGPFEIDVPGPPTARPEGAGFLVFSPSPVTSGAAGMAGLPGSTPRILRIAQREFSKDGDCFSHETKNRSRDAWPCAGGMRSVALVVASCSLAWAAHRHGAGAFDQRHDQSGHRRSGNRASDTA